MRQQPHLLLQQLPPYVEPKLLTTNSCSMTLRTVDEGRTHRPGHKVCPYVERLVVQLECTANHPATRDETFVLTSPQRTPACCIGRDSQYEYQARVSSTQGGHLETRCLTLKRTILLDSNLFVSITRSAQGQTLPSLSCLLQRVPF